MSDRGQRSPRTEIFEHLKILLGQDAVQLAIRVAGLSRSGNSDDALNSLKLYDATLGGIGVYTTNDKRPLGVYRAWFYVLAPLKNPNAEDYSRLMILAACGYLEELLKHVVRLWPWEKIKADRLPMGALVKKASKHLPSDLADELAWLSSGTYNFAKHQINMTDEFGEQQPEHYFQLEEAIAVFLIARHLGLRLEKLTGKSPEQLMME